MPARTRRKIIRKRKPKKNKKGNRTKVLVVILLIIVSVVSFSLFDPSWDGDSKVSVAYFDVGEAQIIVFDPINETLTRITIPGDTQVESAYSLGVVKIKNLEKIAQNEKLGSVLLAKTLTKNLKVPVTHYSGASMRSFFDGSLLGSFASSLTNIDSNLDFPSRLKLALFSSGVINSKRISIDLSEYSFTQESKLVDGSEGILIVRETPSTLTSIFSDPSISQDSYTAKIINGVGDPRLIEQVATTVKNSGLVVTNIENSPDPSTCIVRSQSEKLTNYFSLVFGCTRESKNTESDLEIVLGEDFGDIF